MDYHEFELLRDAIADRSVQVEQRIAAACERGGRDREDIQLVAVSKTHPPETVRAAVEAGLNVLGENRIQEARAKIPECPESIRWHLIGHLQTNKVKVAVPLFDMFHSADSLRVLEAVHRQCESVGKQMPVCLEVNVSGEPAKFGMTPAELPELLEQTAALHRIDVVGLMTIPPFSEDPERTRGFFAQLRELRDRVVTETGFALPELSMGMSNDFEIAIEEGSTFIRIGTDLFGPRRPRLNPA